MEILFDFSEFAGKEDYIFLSGTWQQVHFCLVVWKNLIMIHK